MEKIVAKRFGVHRAPSETLRELAGRVESERSGSESSTVLELLREYEVLRYRGSPPTAGVVRSFARKVHRQLLP